MSPKKPNEPETIKTDSQIVFVVLYKMWEKIGVRKMWGGLGTSIILVSNPVIQYALYDVIKNKLGGNISSLQGFFIGAFTKTLATFATYPLQVGQTRLREMSAKSTLMECLMGIYEEQGLKGLFVGLGPKLAQTVLNAAFMFAFYEMILRCTRKMIASK